MSTNVAIVQDGYNKEDPLSTLKLVSKPIPNPAPGQVVVHIILRPINPTDLNTLRTGRSANGSAGSEGYGVVYQVGEGVTTLEQGQRVVVVAGYGSLKGNGSFQKYVCIDASLVVPVPEEMANEVAAQFLVNPTTAYSMLQELQVPRGEYVIQSAAGSTVGKQVITLARHWGLRTINVVRRAAQKAELEALGADEVICSGEEDVVARAREVTGGRGAWGALDAVSGAMTGTLASCVRDGGQVLLFGGLSGPTAMVSAPDLFRGVLVTGWGLPRKGLNKPAKLQALIAGVAPLVKSGIIAVAQVDKYDLTDFKLAMAKAAEPARTRKVLLVSA